MIFHLKTFFSRFLCYNHNKGGEILVKVLTEKEQRAVTKDNLNRLLKQSNKKIAEIAKDLGLSDSTVRSWFNGQRYPRLNQLELLANYFGVSRNDIEEPQEFAESNRLKYQLNDSFDRLTTDNKKKVIDYSEQLLDEQEHPRDAVKEVPFVGYSAAGTDAEPYCADTTGECAQTNKLDADAFVILTGDSMEPRFHQGEPVFYRSQSDIENGEFAIVEIDGEGAICKQVKMDYKNRKVILHSLNPKYEDIVMDPKRIRILGKVIE